MEDRRQGRGLGPANDAVWIRFAFCWCIGENSGHGKGPCCGRALRGGQTVSLRWPRFSLEGPRSSATTTRRSRFSCHLPSTTGSPRTTPPDSSPTRRSTPSSPPAGSAGQNQGLSRSHGPTPDGQTPYLRVIEALFGADNVDFAMRSPGRSRCFTGTRDCSLSDLRSGARRCGCRAVGDGRSV